MARLHTASLLALRAFEAAARRLSFTAAAQELHVSQAAISRHVRALESGFGRPLFVRLHRQVELTAAGRELAGALTEAFAGIREAVLKAAGNARQTLRLSVEPAFGSLWLAPRLDAFAAAHPHIELQLETSDSIRTLGPDADVAIRFVAADSRARANRGALLLTVEAFPVIAPAAGKRVDTAADVAVRGFRLLHDDDGRAWRAWFKAAAVTPATGQSQQFFTDYALTVEAAERGQGVALGGLPFVRPQLHRRKLKRVGSTRIVIGSYWLLQSSERRSSAVRASFCNWLKREFAAGNAAGVVPDLS
jgi:LysR family glycine cleavage system transcriptional activator